MKISNVEKVLHEHWRITVAGIQPLLGGMNSATWQVWLGEGRWVAKWVPAVSRPTTSPASRT